MIRKAPLSSYNGWEGLRTALGLTLRDHRVRVIFIEDGVYNLLPLSPKSLGLRDFDQFLKSLVELEIPLIAEREAVEERGLKAEARLEATPLNGLAERLQALPEVSRVQTEAQGLRLEATQDIRPQVAKAVLEAGAALQSLVLEQPSLDEVYARYFQEVRHAA